jgi:hypothetical protein
MVLSFTFEFGGHKIQEIVLFVHCSLWCILEQCPRTRFRVRRLWRRRIFSLRNSWLVYVVCKPFTEFRILVKYQLQRFRDDKGRRAASSPASASSWAASFSVRRCGTPRCSRRCSRLFGAFYAFAAPSRHSTFSLRRLLLVVPVFV